MPASLRQNFIALCGNELSRFILVNRSSEEAAIIFPSFSKQADEMNPLTLIPSTYFDNLAPRIKFYYTI